MALLSTVAAAIKLNYPMGEVDSNYVVPLGLTITVLVLGSISSLFTLLAGAVLWRLRKFSERDGLKHSSLAMLANLVAADFCRGLFYLAGMTRYALVYHSNIGPDPDNPCITDYFCLVQSFLSIWFNQITIVCMLLIGILAVYQVAGSGNHTTQISKPVLVRISVACWIIPFFLTLIPAGFGVLGEDQSSTTSGWCWITSCTNITSTPNRVTFMTLYSRGFELMIFVINIALYVYLRFLISTHDDTHLKSNDITDVGLSMSITDNHTSFLSPLSCNVKNDSKLLFLVNISILLIRAWGITRVMIEICIVNKLHSEPTLDLLHKSNQILLFFQAISDSIEGISILVVLLICSQSSRVIFVKILCFRINTGNSLFM